MSLIFETSRNPCATTSPSYLYDRELKSGNILAGADNVHAVQALDFVRGQGLILAAG